MIRRQPGFRTPETVLLRGHHDAFSSDFILLVSHGEHYFPPGENLSSLVGLPPLFAGASSRDPSDRNSFVCVCWPPGICEAVLRKSPEVFRETLYSMKATTATKKSFQLCLQGLSQSFSVFFVIFFLTWVISHPSTWKPMVLLGPGPQ